MRKFLLILIPILTIAIFVAIMFSGNLLKYPMGKDSNLPKAIKTLESDILSEDWEGAQKSFEEMEKVWKKLEKRIQLSEERDEMNYLSVCIARIKGALSVRDRQGAIIELNEAYEHWQNLGS